MEPWLARDRLMIDMLRSIGIEKGKPFNPDAKTEAILNSAAREARALRAPSGEAWDCEKVRPIQGRSDALMLSVSPLAAR
jgi:hypothetical protein